MASSFQLKDFVVFKVSLFMSRVFCATEPCFWLPEYSLCWYQSCVSHWLFTCCVATGRRLWLQKFVSVIGIIAVKEKKHCRAPLVIETDSQRSLKLTVSVSLFVCLTTPSLTLFSFHIKEELEESVHFNAVSLSLLLSHCTSQLILTSVFFFFLNHKTSVCCCHETVLNVKKDTVLFPFTFNSFWPSRIHFLFLSYHFCFTWDESAHLLFKLPSLFVTYFPSSYFLIFSSALSLIKGCLLLTLIISAKKSWPPNHYNAGNLHRMITLVLLIS